MLPRPETARGTFLELEKSVIVHMGSCPVASVEVPRRIKGRPWAKVPRIDHAVLICVTVATLVHALAVYVDAFTVMDLLTEAWRGKDTQENE